MILIVIHGALNNSIKPFIYEVLSNENQNKIVKVNGVSKITLLIILFLSLGLSMVAQDYIFYLIPREYHGALYITPILILGFVLQTYYHNASRILIYHKKVKLVTYSSMVTGLFNIVLNIIFIPKFGVLAAAITTAMSYGLHGFFMSFITKVKFGYSNGGGWPFFLMLLFILINGFFLMVTLNVFWSSILKCLILGGLGLTLYLTNKKIILSIYRKRND
jgi:O-antigen/teichoic acid export membrane protein